MKRAAAAHPKKPDVKVLENGYHPVEPYNYVIFRQELKYIHENPVKAGLVKLPEEYPYSSAIDYSGGKGLLEITRI